MKTKVILMGLMACCATVAWGQLKVAENGNVMIGYGTSTYTPLSPAGRGWTMSPASLCLPLWLSVPLCASLCKKTHLDSDYLESKQTESHPDSDYLESKQTESHPNSDYLESKQTES
ncbi:MAG: hypothetical protein LBF19_07855, partial [Prevotellaceae bacterium]|nr:hypothetical protein [Prevotellaceae bacterium]